jgi:acetyltransferase
MADCEEVVTLAGQTIRLRPIRPEDEPRLHGFFDRLSPEDVRMRFLQPLKRLPQELAHRLSHLDSTREEALLAFDASGEELLGVVRLAAEPGSAGAEFALTIRSDRQGLGLGHLLMTRMLGDAWQRGLGQVFGDVLAENHRMLDLCRSLGAAITQHREDPTLLRVTFRPPAPRSGA